MAADPIIYCLENLTDYSQFERLCHDLMALEGYGSIQPLGAFKDKGRDAIHVSADGSKTTIFAYSVREDWRVKLDEDTAKIAKHAHTCQQVVFLTTSSHSASERDRAIADIFAKYGWKLEIYGLERLRVLLATTRRSVIASHPQIFTPTFFPQAAGLTLVEARDHLVIDYHQHDEALANWLTRRLRLAGYLVWCRSLAPMAGTSINETVESLIKYRAIQYLAILSPTALDDPDLAARRALAGDIVIPITAKPIDDAKLDRKTRELVRAPCDKSWAVGLSQLLDVLSVRQHPKLAPEPSMVLRSYMPAATVANEPEQVVSNRFRVIHIPAVVNGYTLGKPYTASQAKQVGVRWPCRRVNDNRILSFCAPPDDLIKSYGIMQKGGAAWSSLREVEGIRTDHLICELIRRSLESHCVARGLVTCPERGSIYFPENLCKSDRLYFTWPDGSKPFVGTAGRRKLYRPTGSSYYRYFLAPTFSVKRNMDGTHSVLVSVRVRITDDEGRLFPGKGTVSRRKHLCASWFNDEWLSRTLAIMQFLAADDQNIRINVEDDQMIEINRSPDEWTVPVRLMEEAIANARQAREEVLAVAHDEEDDEDGIQGASSE